MGRPSKHPRDRDPTVYPEEERVGEELLQRWIMEILRPLLQRWISERGIVALVGADQFIYYRQHDPHKRIAPDIYLLPGVPPSTRVRSWKIWETGVVPSFALEIVSSDWEKDYAEAPERCQEVGVAELVIFDPTYHERPGSQGARWQIYRRAKRGTLRRIEVSDEERVQSRVLGCWLRVVGFGDDQRLRIGVGRRGDVLVPTAEEAERAAKEAERAAKDAALARVAALEAELESLRKTRGSR